MADKTLVDIIPVDRASKGDKVLVDKTSVDKTLVEDRASAIDTMSTTNKDSTIDVALATDRALAMHIA